MENLSESLETGRENLWSKLDSTYKGMVEMALEEGNNSVEEKISTVAKLLNSYSFARNAFDKDCEREDLECLLGGLELEEGFEDKIFEKYKEEKEKKKIFK